VALGRGRSLATWSGTVVAGSFQPDLTGEFCDTVTSDAPIVGLHVQSRPQTLTIVRGMLSGIAEELSMDPELLDDLKTSVSEACNNVVLHAYSGGAGPMDVRVFVDDDEIRVSVEDRGVGVPETPPAAEDGSGGLGVSVMQALARDVRLMARPGGGTEVLMRFDGCRDDRPLFTAPAAATVEHRPATELGTAEDEVTVTVSPVALLSPVLGRIARALAATAHFSLDRFSDVYLVTDALGAHADHAAVGDRITATLRASRRRLTLALGPFRRGTGRLLEGLAPSPLSVLADEVTVSEGDDGDEVQLVVLDHR
jgi:serine/threonine-protein kinase RsbW